MKHLRITIGAAMLAAMAAIGAWGAAVDEATALTAAERFLQTSAMAARSLPDRSVESIGQRGNLWVVRLAPSGHILLSGSDRATPIIGFSQNDFSEGEEDSAERAMLDAADAAVAAAEADGTKGRHSRWDSLLAEPAASTRKSAKKMLLTSGTDINIAPFVDSKYNQNQPWNDLTPVTSKDSDYIWRGRSCAGCVSIADAAIFRELQWPKYPARTETVTHNLRGENFAIRFNGSVPFDWNNMYDTYGYSGDMRGKTGAEEDKRYEIGRYVLWLNQSASMSYNVGESTSTKSTSAHGAERDWYTIGYSSGNITNTEGIVKSDIVDKVTQTLSAGIPVYVGVPGHATVADGWQDDGDDSFVHIVYGYGGNASDKYYNIVSDTVRYFWLDHYPRAKPQLDPIPRVVGDSVTLSWHFPDCYTNNLSKFIIKKKLRTSATITEWTADFSNLATTGSAYPANVWSTYTFENEDGKVTLNAGDLTYGMYQFSTPLTVTASSVLSLKMRGGANTSGDANKHNIVIEICGEDGNWKELLVPECTWANWPGSWTESTKSLAEYTGQTVQLRIYKRHATYNGRVNIGDFKVTNVIPLEGDDYEQEVAATARSATLTGLTAGADYAFSVVPKLDDNQVVVSGYSVIPEPSDAKIATMAGTHTIPGSGVDVTEDYTTEDTSIVFTDTLQITEDSQLSCTWLADCSNDGWVALKVSFTPDGDEETTVYYNGAKTKYNYQGLIDMSGIYTSPESGEEVCSLAQFAGQNGTLQASIFCSYGDPGNSAVQSITVTNVKRTSEPETESLTAQGMPEFTSIQYAANGGAAADLVDGYLADGSIGSSTLYVTTPTTVTALTATPSHVELVKDENVHVAKVSEGNWEITFDPVIPANRDRQRMILTLNATDTNGTTVHRDVVMRMTEDKIVVGEGETWTLNDDYELTRSLVMAGGTIAANDTFTINQNGISSFTVVSNSTINGTGSLCISNSNATITFENSKSLTNSLAIESANEETLTLAGTGTFVQGAGTTIKVYDMSVGEHVLLNLNLSSDQSTSEAIVQFGNGMASIADWMLRIDAPTDMPKGTYPLMYAATYLSKPNTINLPNLDRECSVEVKNSNTLNFVVGDPKSEQVTDTDYPVPYSWFTGNGIPEGFIDTVKNSQTSSGYKWWQCYVLGLNPQGSGTFSATLTMNGSTPVVTFSPTNETLMASTTMPISYVLQGNASAEGGEWVDTSFDYPGSSYVRFRVDVRWTNSEVKHIYSNEVVKPVPDTKMFSISVPDGLTVTAVTGATDNSNGTYTANIGDTVTIIYTVTGAYVGEQQVQNVVITGDTGDTIGSPSAPVPAVAQIGANYYATLAAAVAEATAENTLTLLQDTAQTLNIPAETTVNLAENGKTFGSLTGTGTLGVSGVLPSEALKTKLQNKDNWEGTFSLSGYTTKMNNFSFNWWGNSNSVVRVDGINGYTGYIGGNGGTSHVAQLRGLEIGDNGLELNDSFAWTSVYIDAPVSGSGKMAIKTKNSKSGADEGTKFIFTGDMSNYTGEIDCSKDSSNGANCSTVVFLGKDGDNNYDTVPTATAKGQVLVSENADITLKGAWTTVGGVIIKGKVTMESTATITGTVKLEAAGATLTVKSGATVTKPTTTVASSYVETETDEGNTVYYVEPCKTVTFVDEDGTSVLDTVGNLMLGAMPEYGGETPTKTADAQYTYTFDGWTPAIEAVVSNTTYTATYSGTRRTVTVSIPFAVLGAVLQSVHIGETEYQPTGGDTSYAYFTIPTVSTLMLTWSATDGYLLTSNTTTFEVGTENVTVTGDGLAQPVKIVAYLEPAHTPYTTLLSGNSGALMDLAIEYYTNPYSTSYVRVMDNELATPNEYGSSSIGYSATERKYARAVAVIDNGTQTYPGYLNLADAWTAAGTGVGTATITLRSAPADTVTVGAGQTLKVIAGAIDLSDNVQFASDVKTSTETVEGVTTYTARNWYNWTLTVTASYATVTGITNATTVIESDPTVSFTVTPADFYRVSSVTANGYALTPDTAGTYSYTLANDTTIEVTASPIEFDDESVAAIINGDEADAFKAWADGFGGVEVVSSNPYVSAAYYLGAAELFDNKPEVDIGSVEVNSTTGVMTLKVTVLDGEDAVSVNEGKVAALFEATSDVDDWESAEKKLTPYVTASSKNSETKEMEFTVTPGDGTSTKAFLRIRK